MLKIKARNAAYMFTLSKFAVCRLHTLRPNWATTYPVEVYALIFITILSYNNIFTNKHTLSLPGLCIRAYESLPF